MGNMGNGKENWTELAKDAVMGYVVVLLAIVCFLLILAAMTAVVRLIVGLGSV